MKLRIDESRLNVERMRQLVELADCGVLVDEDEELIRKIQDSSKEEDEMALLKVKIRRWKKSGKRRVITNKHKPSKNPYFKKPVRDYILNAKKHNVSYHNTTERLNKKFGTEFTLEQVKDKYKKMRR